MSKRKFSVNEYGFLVLGSQFFYRQYAKGKKDTITRKQWAGILKDVTAEIWRAIAEELWRFEIPYLNNEIFVMEIMGTGVPINWKMTRKKQKKIASHNLHTNGRCFKITMKRTHKSARLTKVYKFIPIRGKSEVEFVGKRGLGAYIKRCSVEPDLPDFRGHIC